MDLGNLDEAQSQYDALEDRVEGLFLGRRRAEVLHENQGEVLGFRGNLEEACKLMIPSWQLAREYRDPQQIGVIGCKLAAFLLDLGREKEAEDYLLPALDITMRGVVTGRIFPRSLLAVKSIQEGNLEEGHTWLDESESLFYEYKIRHKKYYMYWVHVKARLLAAEKNWGQAWEMFEESIKGVRELGCMWSVTRYKLNWAEAHLARDEEGDREKGLHMLEEVRAEFNDMGADGWVERVGKRIRELGKNTI